MRIAIIESGGANFLSVTTALERLGANYQLTHDANIIQAADAVILPGVGSAGFSMQKLRHDGLVKVIQNLQQPVLGICLGMQLLYEFSEEDQVDCLGIINGKISKFTSDANLIVPHMGWNNVVPMVDDPIMAGINLENINSFDLYFVHSYYAPVNSSTIARTEYGIDFAAIVRHNNFYGMQFHPEKSGTHGSRLLENFLKIVNSDMSCRA